jgi:type III pantothenate kinase
MILDLDVGNTRVKWRINNANGEAVSDGVCMRDRPQWFDQLLVADIERVRISNVAGAETKRQLQQFFFDSIQVDPEFASSVAEVNGVLNGYTEPERLGVDRWLAVLAAFNRSDSSCCVVDCGSAITIDYVTAAGVHQGGVIAPGIVPMRRALLADTQEIQIRANYADTQNAVPAAQNTEQAVELGLRYMEAGLVEIACDRYERAFNEAPGLYLTGGDALIVSELISRDHEVIPHLVLDGLALAIP